jgi:NCAIR mutase (PurE)-related protein
MDPEALRQLLDEVREGRATVEDALAALRELPFRSLGFAHADTHRHLRTGFPEVILGAGKTAEQIATLLVELGRSGAPVMATRVPAEVAAQVLAAVPQARYLDVPRMVTLGQPFPDRGRGVVAVLTAGTSDVPMAKKPPGTPKRTATG